MNMKERIARALANGAYENMMENLIEVPLAKAEFVEMAWPNWEPRAVLALEARRGATEGMMADALETSSRFGPRAMGNIWDRMIDAALEGG